MGSWISFDKDHESVAKVKQYCESVVFVQFNGQTNELKVRIQSFAIRLVCIGNPYLNT